MEQGLACLVPRRALGQDEPVTIVRLVAQDTIEQAVLALHEQKRALSRGVLEGAELAGALSASELVALIDRGARSDGEADLARDPPRPRGYHPGVTERERWIAEFEAAARRPLRTRWRYAFVSTYKPVLDDAPFRAFDTMEEYRRWCDESLPSWLGYRREPKA